MARLRSCVIGAALLSLWAAPAYATRTAEAPPVPVTFTHEREAFDAWSFDTGWLPAANPKLGSPPPIQLRFVGSVGGGFEARASGFLHLGWQPWQLWTTSEPEGGVLTMDVGAELQVSMRVDLVLPDGTPFFWEGPMPGHEGFDYRFASTAPFAPFLLEGADADQAVVTDTIQKTRLFEIPITEAIIPIPGVAGSLDVDAGGVLDLILKSGRLAFTEGVLSNAAVPLDVPPHDGATHSTEVAYSASAVYAALLELVPQVNLHVGPLEYTLAAFPVPIPLEPIEETWDFDGAASQAVTFALPRMQVEAGGASVTGLQFGADMTSHTVVVRNAGTAPLVVSFSVEGDGFAVTPPGELTIAPGATGARTVTAAWADTPESASLRIDSNDPAGAQLLSLHAEPLVMPCSVAPGPAAAAFALALLVTARTRRRGA